jgi:putative acetyltransferase
MDILNVSPKRKDVAELFRLSNEYAASLYPDESNHLDDSEELSKPNVYFVGAFQDETLVGIGAVKLLSNDGTYGEIKRVFITPDHRGKGVSKLIMKALENFLLEKGVRISRLETGIKQPEAFGLYKRLGYIERAPFGVYKHDPLSLFMEKELNP